MINLKIGAAKFYSLLAGAFILLGLLLKLAQVWLSSGSVDVDSSVVGLMGLHIMQGKALPIFLYGQHYMGSFQAVVASLYFRFLGVSPASLYLVSATFWALFVAANFFLVKRVFGRPAALLASLLLAFPPAYLADRLFRTWGGYMEVLFFGTAIILLTLKIVDDSEKGAAAGRRWGLLGFLVGLSLWIHFSAIFYIATAGIIFLLSSRRKVPPPKSRGWAALSFFLVLLPLVFYNAFPFGASEWLNFPLPTGTERWPTLRFLFHQGQPLKVRLIFGLDNLLNVFKISLPLLLGAQSSPDYFLLPKLSKALLLFYLAVFFWVIFKWDVVFRNLLEFRLPKKETLFRFYPFILGTLAVLAYCFGNFAFSFGDPRYILSFYSVFPVFAAKFLLWVKEKNIVLFVLLLFFVLVNHLYPAYGTHLDVPVFAKIPTRENRLIEKLDELGLSRVYGGYQIAFPITFMTRERIIASPKYGPGNLDRYPQYTRILDGTPDPGYVFPVNGPNNCCEAAVTAVLGEKGIGYKMAAVKGFRIYYELERDIRPYLKPAP